MLRFEQLESRRLLTVEIEPNDTPGAATTLPANQVIEGRVLHAGDIDYFKITLQQGDTFSLQTANVNDALFNPTLPPPVRLFNSAGDLLAESEDGRDLVFTANTAGDYFVRMDATNAYGTFTAPYAMQTKLTAFAGDSESEPNNTTAQADVATPGKPFRGSLSGSDSVDVYSITLAAGDGLSIDFAGIQSTGPGIRLLDGSGSILASNLEGLGLSYVVSTSGSYWIELVANSAGGGMGPYVAIANSFSDATANLMTSNDWDSAVDWNLGTKQSTAVGFLDTPEDTDFYRFEVNSLANLNFTLSPVGTDTLSDQNRLLVLFNAVGQIISYSTSGSIDLFEVDAIEMGTHYLGVWASSIAGLGSYGLRSNANSYLSLQRDVPLQFIDFDKQQATHQGFAWVNSFAVPEAIPFIVGMFESRYEVYGVDVTTTKPTDVAELVTHGYGDFGDIGAGGWGGGSSGQRRSSGAAVSSATQTSWPSLSYGSINTLNHEFGHSVGLPHARVANAFMAYVGTNELLPIGDGYAFRGTDSRRPGFAVVNERNYLDWTLQAGSQAIEQEPNGFESPQPVDEYFSEMTADLRAEFHNPTGSNPNLILDGDFNGDGKRDLVVSSANSNDLRVYLGDGAGNFQARNPITVPAIGWWTEPMVVGDFNGDGRSDVAVLSYSNASMTVLTSSSAGDLGNATTINLGTGAQSIAAGDFNGDSKLDIVVAQWNDRISVLLGSGTGNFGAPAPFAMGDNPYSVSVGDFDNDGKLDVATANNGDNTMSYRLGDGAGSFGAVATMAVANDPRGITSADFNGDGRDDLAVASRSTGLATILLASDSGGFSNGIEQAGHPEAQTVSSGDFNRDGITDILIGGFSNALIGLLGDGQGNFSRPVSLLGQNSEVSAVVADFNSDGFGDVALASYWSDSYTLLTSLPNNVRNDIVTVYGRINGNADQDYYSLKVAAGETYAFDIDSAEFQYPLDAQIRIVTPAGQVIAENLGGIDRESGIDSVDPYLVHTFTTAGTYLIEVSGEFGSAGSYRFKAVPERAFDQDGPKVLATVPDGGSTQDATGQIIFFMNDQVDPATLTSQNVVVTGASTGIQAGQARFNPLDATIVWTANSVLPPDTYTVQLIGNSGGVADLRGNLLDGEVTNFRFPVVSGDGTVGGNFQMSFTINAPDSSAAATTRVVYDRDPYQRGQFTLYFSDSLSVASVEDATFILRGAGPDGVFQTADDRLSSLDVNLEKIRTLSLPLVELYTQGIPDPDLYRIEASLRDAALNPFVVSQTINVGVSVPQSAIFQDAAQTQPGLVGSYVNQSLRTTTAHTDWRTSQTISGTRVDYSVDFTDNSFGVRSDVGITGGTDANWDNFSVQWDGWIRIAVDGTRLQTRSDDGSRLWIDVNHDGSFDTSGIEFADNGWGTGHAEQDGALTEPLPAGVYQIRMQYEEGGGGNSAVLQWISPGLAGQASGYGHGPAVIGMNITPNTVYSAQSNDSIAINFSGAVDAATLTTDNFLVRYSSDATFFDGNDQVLADENNTIAWDPVTRSATWQYAETLPNGFYRVELNGDVGGISSTAGQLLDGEFLSTYVAGNTNTPFWNHSPSGDGIPGGDYVATFTVATTSLGLLASPPVITENGETTEISVYRSTLENLDLPLTVQLSVSDPSKLFVPATIVIPGGSRSTTFTATAIDNALFDGTVTVTLTGTATDADPGSVNITILDHEALELAIAPSSISEQNGTAMVTLRRPGTVGDLIVALSNSLPSRLVAPNSITILDGQSSISFPVQAIDNTVVDGTGMATLTASAVGYLPATQTLSITDHEQLALVIDAASIDELGGSTTAVITRTDPVGDLVVDLTSTATDEINFPSQIVIPAGQLNSAPFVIDAINDGVGDGPQTAVLRAQASGYIAAADSVIVVDAQQLSLEADQTTISELDGIAMVRVKRLESAGDRLVNLSANSPEITFPSTVTILDGQTTSEWFEVRAVDNAIVDGRRLVRMTADSIDYFSASVTLQITDYEELIVTQTGPQSFSENLGTSTFTITRTDSRGDLQVTLSSSDTGELQVPAQIIIPDGQLTSSSVVVTGVDDDLADGTQSVSVRALAAGYVAGATSFQVLDEELLSLQIDNAVLSENGGSTTVTVTRGNADRQLPLVVSIINPDPSELDAPLQVTIPAFSTSAQFTLNTVDDDELDGTQTVVLSAQALGYIDATAEIQVTDSEALTLSLDVSSLSERNGTATGTIRRPQGSSRDALVIHLASSDSSEATVPSSVTIPAGESEVSFPVTAVDDDLLDGTQRVDIDASAEGYSAASISLDVQDHEALMLEIAASAIQENAAAIEVMLRRPAGTLGSEVQVTLATTSTRISIPTSVTIPGDSESVTFLLTPIDNQLLDGDTTESLSAQATGFISGTDSIQVIDAETLHIAFDKLSVSELGETVQGTVTRSNTDNSQPLVIDLSEISQRLQVPAQVTILANQQTATFSALAIDDALLTGTVLAQVTASAVGYTNGSAEITIEDHEQIQLAFSTPTVREDQQTVTLTVARENTNTELPLDVMLVASSVEFDGLPSQITIPSGAQSIDLTLTTIDNQSMDGRLRNVAIAASATGYINTEATVAILDYEPLMVNASTVRLDETGGTTTITISRGQTSDLFPVEIQLNATPAGRLTLPASVNLPGGVESVDVTITAIDNDLLTGLTDLQLVLNAPEFEPTTLGLQIEDVEQLSIAIGATAVAEGIGQVQATVRRSNTNTESPITVALTSSDTSLLTTPNEVTIPAGTMETIVLLQIVDDVVVEPDQSVEITVEHAGYFSGSKSLTIINDDFYSWTNQINHLDVNNDGGITPLDVLLIINAINAGGSRSLPPPLTDPGVYYDVNEDEFLSAIDSLQIINHLNGAGSSEGEAHAVPITTGIAAGHDDYRYDWNTEWRKRKETASIDAYFASFEENQ